MSTENMAIVDDKKAPDNVKNGNNCIGCESLREFPRECAGCGNYIGKHKNQMTTQTDNQKAWRVDLSIIGDSELPEGLTS